MSKNLLYFRRIQEQISKLINADALIAGGCIRDHLCNVGPYKDIDVFIPCTSEQDFKNLLEKIAVRFGTYQFREGSLNDDYNKTKTSPNLVKVADFKVRFNTSLQIVGARKVPGSFAENVFNHFDFGINCCGVNSSGIISTRDFSADKANQTFTIKNVWSPEQLIKLVDKYKRLTEIKYRGYSLAYNKEAFH